jgi:hypothetical protein
MLPDNSSMVGYSVGDKYASCAVVYYIKII